MKHGIVDGALDLEAIRRAVASPGRGAVVLFLGSVRDRHQGAVVAGIEYSAYRSMAERVLAGIVADLEREHAADDLALAIVHRVGGLAPGEISIVIASASAHRTAAYEANRRALERVKREAPIWKRERYADGTARWRQEEPLTT